MGLEQNPFWSKCVQDYGGGTKMCTKIGYKARIGKKYTMYTETQILSLRVCGRHARPYAP